MCLIGDFMAKWFITFLIASLVSTVITQVFFPKQNQKLIKGRWKLLVITMLTFGFLVAYGTEWVLLHEPNIRLSDQGVFLSFVYIALPIWWLILRFTK